MGVGASPRLHVEWLLPNQWSRPRWVSEGLTWKFLRASCVSTLTQDSSRRNQRHFPFLRLPAELRNKIYMYALGGKTWIIALQGGRGSYQSQPDLDDVSTHPMALLQSCRQVYAEASLFPYAYNTFEGWHGGHLHVWVQSLSHDQRTAVASIRRTQRSWVIQSATGLAVSPFFWMDVPLMADWGLAGLKDIEIKVVLSPWTSMLDQTGVRAAKLVAAAELQKMVEKAHPGVKVHVHCA